MAFVIQAPIASCFLFDLKSSEYLLVLAICHYLGQSPRGVALKGMQHVAMYLSGEPQHGVHR